MTHELFIELSLAEKEVHSRTDFSFTLSIKNRGKTPFPGGQFTDFKTRFPNVLSDYTQKDLPEIPKINPEDTKTLDPIEVFAYEDGICWIELMVKAKDGEKVSLYRNDEPENKWILPIYIFNKESMKIIELLESIMRAQKVKMEKNKND